ncbi:Detected protein of confused Function [Hibiscus syriacus]|uniref:Detected protein of confused Function n=1 Tax=Hibiscus syriacus TaxID=106335 RepID=A0A6A3BC15_HIBSY|nr:Detected protein of confused Function [Hibiscus syriacus]
MFLWVPEIVCGDLPHDNCAFSISSSGKRCLLETAVDEDVKVVYQCRTSEVVVERMAEHIESDQCVRACGVDRNAIGISSDSLLEPQFTNKLCAPACSYNCPNIVDLFFNLAAGEGIAFAKLFFIGVFLPDLCEVVRINPRRSMAEFMSSSGAAAGPGPIEAELLEDNALASAPAPDSME